MKLRIENISYFVKAKKNYLCIFLQYIDDGREGRSFGVLEMLRNNGKTKIWQGPVRAYHENTAYFTEDYFFIAKVDDFMRVHPFFIHARVSHFIKKEK